MKQDLRLVYACYKITKRLKLKNKQEKSLFIKLNKCQNRNNNNVRMRYNSGK